MSKWKGLKQTNGRVAVVRSSAGTDSFYDSDTSVVDTTEPFEAETREEALKLAENELRHS